MASSPASLRNGLAAAVALAASGGLMACEQTNGRAPPAQQKATSMTSAPGDTQTPAAALAAEGRTALAAGDHATANAKFDAALAALGSGYAAPDTLDDAGMMLVKATADAKQGRLEAAARTKAQVLDARLAMAARKTD